MNVSQLFEKVVAERVAEGPAPWSIEAGEGDVTVAAELTANERLACAFRTLEVRNRVWSAAPLEQVKRVAEGLSRRLTYLLEPVRPIEVDGEACIVQMRSQPPRVGESATSYYELQVRGGGAISLCRYEKPPGEPRRPIDVEVTREVLRQLVDDLASAKA